MIERGLCADQRAKVLLHQKTHNAFQRFDAEKRQLHLCDALTMLPQYSCLAR